MPLITTAVNSLVNGVSQQAENLRFTSQVSSQRNATSSLLTGLTKRPPTEYVSKLNLYGLSQETLLFDKIDRSEDEKFLLALGSKRVLVFDLEGNPVPVMDENGALIGGGDSYYRDNEGNYVPSGGADYLQCVNPSKDLQALTVADYTILLNRSRTTALKSTVTPKRPPEAIVMVKAVRSSSTYSISIYNDPNSTTPDYVFSHATGENTTEDQATIAASLIQATAGVVLTETTTWQSIGGHAGGAKIPITTVVGNGNTSSGGDARLLYDIYEGGGLIYITRKDGMDFRVDAYCTNAESMFAFKDSVQTFSALPKKGWTGFTIKVNGNPDDDQDDYYLRFEPSTPGLLGFCEGSWVEAVAGGQPDQIDEQTMPHALVNHGTHFVYKPLEWRERLVGDAETNPAPSCIGKKIRGLFFHRNRLGLLAEENAVLSEASEFFNLWRTTVIQLLDSDPIDLGATNTKIALLNHAVELNEKLLLFAEPSQSMLDGGELLTPKSASIKQETQYPCLRYPQPVRHGNNIYFPFKRGEFTGFFDYGLDSNSGLYTADDITDHVPCYIKGEVDRFDMLSTQQALLAKTENDDILYVYRFFKQNGQRLQSAWAEYDFGDPLKSFVIFGTTVYLLLLRNDGMSIEKIEMAEGLKDGFEKSRILLDRRVTDERLVSATYNATDDATELLLPYRPDARSMVLSRSTATVDAGAVLQVVSVDGPNQKIVVRGNATGPLWIGLSYHSSVELTRPQLRQARGQGEFVVVPGRFQLRYGLLAYNDSVYFKVSVAARGRPVADKVYSSRILGTDTSIVGLTPTQEDGVFRFPIFSKNENVTITLTNDSPFQSAFLSIDWEALYAARSQSV